REKAIGFGEVWIKLDRPPEQALRLDIVGRSRFVKVLRPEPEKVPGMQRRNGFALGADPLGGADLGFDSRCNGHRDLVLQVEKLPEVAIVALGPQLPPGFRLGQLNRDAHAIRGPSYA